jgi:hypothetical protein
VIAKLFQRGDRRKNASRLAACQDAADLFAVQEVLVNARLRRNGYMTPSCIRLFPNIYTHNP